MKLIMDFGLACGREDSRNPGCGPVAAADGYERAQHGPGHSRESAGSWMMHHVVKSEFEVAEDNRRAKAYL